MSAPKNYLRNGAGGDWGTASGFENGSVVPSENFDYNRIDFEAMDSPEDRVREGLKAGRPIDELIADMVADRELLIAAEGARLVLHEIISAKHWLRAAVVLCFACGLADDLNWTQPYAGKKFGVTKQAINQGVRKFREMWLLRKTRMMRSDEAKATMRRVNFRHFKGE